MSGSQMRAFYPYLLPVRLGSPEKVRRTFSQNVDSPKPYPFSRLSTQDTRPSRLNLRVRSLSWVTVSNFLPSWVICPSPKAVHETPECLRT